MLTKYRQWQLKMAQISAHSATIIKTSRRVSTYVQTYNLKTMLWSFFVCQLSTSNQKR